jgi:hypothetical protein
MFGSQAPLVRQEEWGGPDGSAKRGSMMFTNPGAIAWTIRTAVQVCELDHHGRLRRPRCKGYTLGRSEGLRLALDQCGQRVTHLGLEIAEPTSVTGSTYAAHATLRKEFGNLTPCRRLCLTKGLSRPNEPASVLAAPRFLSRKSAFQPPRKHVLACQPRAAAERTSSRPAHAHHARTPGLGLKPA